MAVRAEPMFSFLRRRKPVAPTTAPAAGWDGFALTLPVDAPARTEVALEVDGIFFTSAPIDADGRARFDFAFSPTSDDRLTLLARLGRDGPALGASALEVRYGVPGCSRAHSVPVSHRPASPRQTLPLSADVDLRPIDIAIVIPVYNAPDLVRRCLDSVLAHSTGRAQLIVIDDASPDPAITPLLEAYRGLPGVSVVNHSRNLGFTGTANHGIALAGDADVVLLNADAEVGPNWLRGLCRAAYSDPSIGSATAVSDNAGAFSVPELERDNPLPDAWSFEQCVRGVWQQAGLDYPTLPTGNGFCLYLRRSMLDRVGILDEEAFAEGYGEENDLCQRAAAVGLRHVIAGNVLVRHARSMSFGAERRIALGRAGMAVLRKRWPNYEADVAATLFSFERRVLDWRVRRLFASASAGSAPRPRVLLRAGDSTQSNALEVWHVRQRRGGIELADAFDTVIAEAGSRDPRRVFRDWLQAHAIEGVVADLGDALAAAALPLGIVVAPSLAGINEAFESARTFAPGVR